MKIGPKYRGSCAKVAKQQMKQKEQVSNVGSGGTTTWTQPSARKHGQKSRKSDCSKFTRPMGISGRKYPNISLEGIAIIVRLERTMT